MQTGNAVSKENEIETAMGAFASRNYRVLPNCCNGWVDAKFVAQTAGSKTTFPACGAIEGFAMKIAGMRRRMLARLVAGIVLGACVAVHAQQTNSWITGASGNWDQAANWSLGVLPATSQSVLITNPVSKAVAINPSTPVNFPGSMTVGNLTIAGPTNTENTLLLNFVSLTPLKVVNSCFIQTNGAVLNLSSSFEVDGGANGTWTIDGGAFTGEGGSTMANVPVNVIGGGVINSTNSAVTLGQVTLGVEQSSGNLNQDGGSLLSQSLVINNGQFTLASGTFYGLGGTVISPAGSYLQWGGTNYGDIINGGDCTVDGGLAHGNRLAIAGRFFQGGGVVEMQTVDWTANNGNVLDLGILRAQNINIHSNALVFMGEGDIVPGTVEADSLSISNSAAVSALAYNLFVTNDLVMAGDSSNAPASLQIEGTTGPGAFLSVGTITMWDNSIIGELGNTEIEISSNLDMRGGRFLLSGGNLDSVNIGVGKNATFTQQIGQSSVHGVLSITGVYNEGGGSVVVNGLYLRGSLVLSGGTFTNTGTVNLGGFLGAGSPEAVPGEVILATNATIGFIGSPAQLNFAASSGQSWTPGALMVISNWNSSGNTHLFFGADASALSSSQLAQVQFSNPGGFAPGSYSAKILNTGEVVPNQVISSGVAFSVQGNNFVVTWPSGFLLQTSTNVFGPYSDVPGATSPYTNDITLAPMRFFRLRQ